MEAHGRHSRLQALIYREDPEEDYGHYYEHYPMDLRVKKKFGEGGGGGGRWRREEEEEEDEDKDKGEG